MILTSFPSTVQLATPYAEELPLVCPPNPDAYTEKNQPVSGTLGHILQI